MIASRSRRLLLAVVAALALLSSSATVLALTPVAPPRPALTFVRNPTNPVIYAAFRDGTGVHRITAGRAPRFVGQDTIAYLREGRSGAQDLMLAPAAGGPSRLLMRNWRESDQLAFGGSPTKIAALRGPEVGKRKLVLIDFFNGVQRTIASGYFSGFSFSPEGDELVYARAAKEGFPMRSDVYQVPVGGGRPLRITDDGRSQNPLWGPSGKIVFSKWLEARQRRYGPKSELYLMNPGGRSVQRLTHTKVGPLLLGLFPTEWGAGGDSLLAEFEGQDTSYAVAVSPESGAQHPIGATGERGFVGTALSGSGEVLGFTGGFEPGPGHRVVTIPYVGGTASVLAENAFEPDWSE